MPTPRTAPLPNHRVLAPVDGQLRLLNRGHANSVLTLEIKGVAIA